MSELGLTFEDSSSRGRHRHRRGSNQEKAPKRRGAGKSFLAFVLVVALLGTVGYGGWWAFEQAQKFIAAEDYSGDGTGSVVVEVREGMTGADVGQVLAEADVVASQRAFVEAYGDNSQAVSIQGGCYPFLDGSPCFYQLRQQMSAAAAVTELLNPDSQLTPQQAAEQGLIRLVTVPEGLSSFRTFDLLSEELDIPVEEFEAAADPIELGVPEFWFNRTDEVEVDPTIEGFLFPATYEFPPDPSAEEVLEAMVRRFLTVAEELDFVDRVQQERNILPYMALIVASLAQAEAGVEEDLGRIARVAYNRLYTDTPELGCARCLQFDVTVNYWFELNGEPTKSSAEMTEAELTDPDNPYNRDREGLVPTPINNPGQLALEAAMDPPEGDWIYFVAIDEEGNSAFASTFEEHCQNGQVAVEAGILDIPC